MKSNRVLWVASLFVIALALAACGGQKETPTAEPTVVPLPTQACPEQEPCPSCPTCPEPPPPVEPVVKEVPYQEQWANSPHNDATAEAFNHWNEDDPKEVPANCAKCHSTPGYQDFLGADGSAVGAVDAAAPIGTTIQCVACHNPATATMNSVTFPSGVEIMDLGPQSRCMVCHQGRASKVQVDAAIEKNASLDDPDSVGAELGFVNIHYFAAAATRLGTEVKGGYEYDGKTYDARFDHVAGVDTCIGCHNPHTLEIKLDTCKTCHTGVNSPEDLKAIRMAGSLVDYDGDGDTSEGIASEIEGLQAMLYQAIQAYAIEKAGAAIVYDAVTYPYFLSDANGNGAVDAGEGNYTAWTGRLLRAAYNYQTSIKDPGAFAHGGKYIIELLYDSIEDLNTVISTPVDLSQAHRLDAGHFASSEEPFRHWDAEGLVPGDCAKCHSAEGLPTFLGEASRNRDGVTGTNIAVDVSSGLNCATCHNDLATFTRREVLKVKFPSGAVLDIGDPDSNLCLSCHQGRESGLSLNRAITAAAVEDDDTVSERLRFANPHYFAAGATLFGADANGAYQYAGKAYNGRNQHVPAFSTCIQCHNAHALTVNIQQCSVCHAGVATIEDVQNIRMDTAAAVDHDGDGDTTEGIANEIATVNEKLYAAIQEYAATKAGTAILYAGDAYPYFFSDANANGQRDEGEGAYATWTARLLRAAYNYQWVAKDPGAFAHNGDYILQVLYDSLEDLGGDTTGLNRPTPPPAAAP
jgi:hypothetical protein